MLTFASLSLARTLPCVLSPLLRGSVILSLPYLRCRSLYRWPSHPSSFVLSPPSLSRAHASSLASCFRSPLLFIFRPSLLSFSSHHLPPFCISHGHSTLCHSIHLFCRGGGPAAYLYASPPNASPPSSALIIHIASR
ncbi:hypothetical protein DFH09DRAFT_1200212 [Mycena vulgaris]|nr:hypothetical protein DFH09DRAFT_1200212 [Mycena vulgaris]